MENNSKHVQIIQFGEDQLHIEAKGRFTDKDAREYSPNHESDNLRVALPEFEGPLDLLLFLIRRHHMDILDIPIAEITAKYIESIEQIHANQEDYDIDLAGEFLLMAATLAQIKSAMLLPKEEEELEEEGDPRADLVRRLLEYQKFKEVAAGLGEKKQLGRDLFARKISFLDENSDLKDLEDERDINAKLKEVEIYEVMKSFSTILKRLKPSVGHTVQFESISVRARMLEVIEYLKNSPQVEFEKLLLNFDLQSKMNVIVTFVSMLELTRLKLVKIKQDTLSQKIFLEVVSDNLSVDDDMILTDMDDGDMNEDLEN